MSVVLGSCIRWRCIVITALFRLQGTSNGMVNGHRPAGGRVLQVGDKESVVIGARPHMTHTRSNHSLQVLEAQDGMGLTWSHCAQEGQNCSCSSGVVRYGVEERWVTTQPGQKKTTILCSKGAAEFGGIDPAVRRMKQCWCLRSPVGLGKSPTYPGVAIVLLSRRAFDLKTWLQYHLNYLNVTHVFLDVEDTPGFEDTWQKVSKRDRDRITLTRSPLPDGIRPLDNFTSLQVRQIDAMKKAKVDSRSRGIEWLFHIDDDELLYIPTHRSIGEALSSVPLNKSQVILPNVEAIFNSVENIGEHCFTQASLANFNIHSFVSYSNGKSALRVSSPLPWVPLGPHAWRLPTGPETAWRLPGGSIYPYDIGNKERRSIPDAQWPTQTVHLDSDMFGPAVWLIHYESCPFGRWKDKYWELGNTSPNAEKIPFSFYRESIERMQCCGARQEDGATQGGAKSVVTNCSIQKNSHECCENGMQELWGRWKTMKNPRFKSQDMVHIDIPWDKIKTL